MEMNNRGLYICIEGLDGSGKSTVFNYLKRRFEKQGVEISTVAPTKMLDSNKNNFIEGLFRKSKLLNGNRTARAFLYAHRSNQAATGANWKADLILGDRSLVTSYVVRWSKIKIINYFVVLMVDVMENKIIAPDHVIFIDVPYKTLNERLNNRGINRDIDENEQRSQQMKEAYYSMRNDSSIKRITKVQWHIVSGDGDPETVGNNVYELVRKIFEANKIT